MGNPSQYVLSKSNYMPVDTLKTIQQNESLIVMPMARLSEILAQIRDK